MTSASRLPATTRSSRPRRRWSYVGLISSLPSSSPTLTAAMFVCSGISEIASAAEAPVKASTSESLSVSAEMTKATTCVS